MKLKRRQFGLLSGGYQCFYASFTVSNAFILQRKKMKLKSLKAKSFLFQIFTNVWNKDNERKVGVEKSERAVSVTQCFVKPANNLPVVNVTNYSLDKKKQKIFFCHLELVMIILILKIFFSSYKQLTIFCSNSVNSGICCYSFLVWFGFGLVWLVLISNSFEGRKLWVANSRIKVYFCASLHIIRIEKADINVFFWTVQFNWYSLFAGDCSNEYYMHCNLFYSDTKINWSSNKRKRM